MRRCFATLRRSALLAIVCSAVLPLRAAEPSDGVKRAIDWGIKFLKETPPESTGIRKQPPGALGLWGLTLLECGVPANDPAIQKAARELRQTSIELTHNYSLSAAILFFDRLGDPGDIYLIQTLAVRLLAGQSYADGWSYQAPRPSPEEIRRLTAWLKQRNEPAAKPPAVDKKKPPALPPELQEQIKLSKRQPAGDDRLGVGDNSNTQFAVMALWTARRHGIPVEDALTRANKRFRDTQGNDGGWTYIPTRGGQVDSSTASMTCAGLLALAMAHGAAAEAAHSDPKAPKPADLGKDPAIRSALVALGSVVGTSSAGKGQPIRKGYYFLWSLERVGVAYNLNAIAAKDWYAWGSDILLANQRDDGSWRGEEAPEIDTCFALLFLRRANLATDLSASLKGISDLGQVTLKAGGVGGEGIEKRIKPSLFIEVNRAEGPRPLPKDLDPEVYQLCKELLKASAERQPKLIESLKDNKGIVYTDALAVAIPRLHGALQDKARDALAERLMRMTATTLRGKLTEEDVEVRVAAIRACASKEDKAYIPDLIGLLTEKEARVAAAAHKALTIMTGQDFGPASGAPEADRDQAVVAWKAWWQKQASK
jgi:hypothetical protein